MLVKARSANRRGDRGRVEDTGTHGSIPSVARRGARLGTDVGRVDPRPSVGPAMRPLSGNLRALSAVTMLLSRHRGLVLEMASREIRDRFAGQVFGWLWAIGHPLFVIGLYVFVFAVVFRQKVGGTVEMPLDYTAYLLSGLVAWLGVQDALTKSCSSLVANSSLVKQVVFPIEVLPAKTVLACLFTQGVSLAALVAYALASSGRLHPTYLLLPVVLLMQVATMLGVGFALSAVGAYFRDLKDFVQLFATAGIYLLPVVYLPEWVPPAFKPALFLNPFSYLLWCYQDVLYFGRFEHPWAWGAAAAIALASLALGFRVFMRLKPGLGNVL